MGLLESIGGLAGAGGLDFGLGMISANQERKATSYEARKLRSWQSYMSDTAHQREVADLEAAGLNPILSVFGSGASTPSGAMPKVPSISEHSSHVSSARMAAAQTSQILAQARKSNAEASVAEIAAKRAREGAGIDEDLTGVQKEIIPNLPKWAQGPGRIVGKVGNLTGRSLMELLGSLFRREAPPVHVNPTVTSGKAAKVRVEDRKDLERVLEKFGRLNRAGRFIRDEYDKYRARPWKKGRVYRPTRIDPEFRSGGATGSW